MAVFNENYLRKLINDRVEKEFQKYWVELHNIWEYINQLREEIKSTKNLIASINQRK